MVLEIDGFDIVPYIAYQGLKWQREDIDGPDAGRDLSGDLTRNRVNTKRRLDVTCRPLTGEETSLILSAVMPEWVTVRYCNPQNVLQQQPGQLLHKAERRDRTMERHHLPAYRKVRRRYGL